MIGDRQRPSAAYVSSLSSIVTFKSLNIRDYIISKKHKKNLTINQSFAVDQPGNIFAQEFLPAPVYSLLLQRDFKHVRVRSGAICVRKLDWSDIVVVRSDFVQVTSDLTSWRMRIELCLPLRVTMSPK